ncbi:unnamed protein product [Periconia digitata]|uniref:Uncharacterized protein n=1 Tax=Periconia digitata TaxID=1303443 RepID=A0A9W4UD74_9PLEO|nr:unnamed protein product [Periconia digitata]
MYLLNREFEHLTIVSLPTLNHCQKHKVHTPAFSLLGNIPKQIETADMTLTNSALHYTSLFLGTVTIGFGLHYTLFPRSAFNNFGFAPPSSSVKPSDLELLDSILILFGAKDLFVGVSIWAAALSGNKRLTGVNILALGLCAALDGWIVKRSEGVVAGAEWGHWGYGSVALVLGAVMLS